jgi:4'-phosphopantetheinyl transferase
MSLDGREVHVWDASLTQPAHVVESLRRSLSPDELRRAEAFRFELHRERFIVGRGLLRNLLGGYLAADPRELRFTYTKFGKPGLSEPHAAAALRFNFSSSHEEALCCFASGREVGVDIEHLRPDVECEELAERFFSTSEREALLRLPPGDRRAAFFNCWTRKEAFIKAVGEGLSFPLDRFDVSLAPGEPASLLSVMGDAEKAARWSLKELAAPEGYAAALVVEGHGWTLRRWRWGVEQG